MSAHLDIALLLAAGAARRMGQPKQALGWRGAPLLVRAVETARRAGLWPVVVLGAHRAQVEPLLDAEVERVIHPDWAEGMGSSLRVGLEATLRRHQPERVTIMVCDQPLITDAELRRLVASCQGFDAAAAAYEGVLGTPACVARSSFEALLRLAPGQGARRLLRGGALRVAAVPMASAAIDLDTPEDVRMARAMDDRCDAIEKDPTDTGASLQPGEAPQPNLADLASASRPLRSDP